MKQVKLQRRRGFTRLSGKRQVTLPLHVVNQLGLEPGDELKVDTEDGRVVLTRQEGVAVRRLKAIHEMAGTLSGIWKPGDLDRLRDEWR
ncbi:MAG TPA: AbrB/MazE/SpoVT family DNA-binding domain-containing protein [Candidatus Dormibacteraeota bacterium]|nr:AbrB/MazE/SpoVT family DNA-binding domain-containing protein [Candidatus Dormibacteraeota bacterium]